MKRAELLKKSKARMDEVRIGIYEGEARWLRIRGAVARCAVVETHVDDPKGSRVKGCFLMRVSPTYGEKKGSCAHMTATHLLQRYTLKQEGILALDGPDQEWIAAVLWNSKVGRPYLDRLTRAIKEAKKTVQGELPLFKQSEPEPDATYLKPEVPAVEVAKPEPEPEDSTFCKPAPSDAHVFPDIGHPPTIEITEVTDPKNPRKFQGTPAALRAVFG